LEHLAESLAANANGTERQLLSKSLQEALYYAVGFKTDLEYRVLKTHVAQYLERWGRPSFIRRFLSLFFFNFVRSETGESFRRAARSSSAFEKYLEEIDRACRQTVTSVWKSVEKTNRPLDRKRADELLSRIEQRLRGE
jgi:hypothetical protein